ncbi:hypothetical protein [Yersinia rochesterensis]|uniref:hypothetical protein n=1 Tax=Yersinia rochesterensis TaxID=1604335 RepID=UPI0011A73A22|nr:hypothetical protein [Yersinia rochesterensis]
MEKIVCGLCNAEIGVNMLSNHLLSKHGWKMAPKSAMEVPTALPEACKCPICNVSLKDSGRLKKHLDKAHAKAGISSQSLSQSAKKQSISTISYSWALTQKLDKKYTGVVDKFVAEKTLLEIEKEITLIVNGYDAADFSRQSLMSGRLIILSHAKKRIEAKNKSSKNKKSPAKRSKTGRVHSGDIMDQYIGGKRIVISGGLPSLGKR